MCSNVLYVAIFNINGVKHNYYWWEVGFSLDNWKLTVPNCKWTVTISKKKMRPGVHLTKGQNGKMTKWLNGKMAKWLIGMYNIQSLVGNIKILLVDNIKIYNFTQGRPRRRGVVRRGSYLCRVESTKNWI